MKRSSKKPSKKVTKGTSQAVILSALIHVGLFLLAGTLVVFTVVRQKEVEFEPPKAVDRPKMKLKKPKVKVKRSSKPKATARITSKTTKAVMPDMELPEMGGVGEGLGEGMVGGFDMMPELEEISLLGETVSVGNDFVGTFYDFTRHANGRANSEMAPATMHDIMARFFRNGWDTSIISRFYRAPKKLYASFFCVPVEHSTIGPSAFGQPDASSWCWIVHYKGKLVYPEDITFRFWGQGDDYMVVRVDGEMVLLATWPQGPEPHMAALWQSESASNRSFPMGSNKSVVGDWITLKAGEAKDMEVIIGEGGGGLFGALLAVEVKGVEYPKRKTWGGPILPLFKTDDISRDMADMIYFMLHEGDVSVTNGPVFRDFEVPADSGREEIVADGMDPTPEVEAAAESHAGPRTWTKADGSTFDAEYVAWVAGRVVVKNKRGKQVKLAIEEFSDEDQTLIELANPPKFDLGFSKAGSQVDPPKESPFVNLHFPIKITEYNFGVKMKKASTKPYGRELKIEYFAIGDERTGDNQVLLQRCSSTFTPSEENKGNYEFFGDPVRVESKSIWPNSPFRGTKYGGYLIVVTDERGEVIQYKTSNEYLYDIVDILREFPVGKRFNKQGERTWPPRPGQADRNPWVFR